MSIKRERLCTSRQAAEILGVSARTVQLWADAGVISSWKTPGGHRRYSLEEVGSLANDIVAGNAPSLSRPEEHSPSGESKSLKILVVEDEEAALRAYQRVFRRWNLPIELITASDGYSGILKVGQLGPDLLILDINLPNINGFQIVRTLAENDLLASMKLIIVSALDPMDIEHKLPAGLEYRILSKPIPFDAIEEDIQQLLRSRHL